MQNKIWRWMVWILAVFVFCQTKSGFTEEIKVIRFGLIPSEEAHKLLSESRPFIDAFEKKNCYPRGYEHDGIRETKYT